MAQVIEMGKDWIVLSATGQIIGDFGAEHIHAPQKAGLMAYLYDKDIWVPLEANRGIIYRGGVNYGEFVFNDAIFSTLFTAYNLGEV